MSGLLLTAAGDELELRLRKAFDGRLNGDLRCALDASVTLEAIAEAHPLVVAIGPSVTQETAIELASSIDRDHPEVSVVLMTSPTPQLWEQALRAGVRDIVAPDAPLGEVRASFERALDAAHRRRASWTPEAGTGPTSRVIAVVSPKGGAGKTAIASNLAVGLAQLAPQQVVVVDLDLQFGDIASALRLAPEQTIADSAHAPGPIDATSIKAYLTPHAQGLFALCAPSSPAAADDVDPEHTAKVLSLLADEFRYVVVDTSAGLDWMTIAAMDHATDVVLVAGTDVASARSMRKEIEAFDILGYTKQQRHFVLNRADARVGLGAGDIALTVGLEAAVEIPSARAVPLSMNQGVPVLESAPRSPVARALGELVSRIAVGASVHQPEVSGGARFRRRKETR
jgi:pilus assembly protein CpaE